MLAERVEGGAPLYLSAISVLCPSTVFQGLKRRECLHCRTEVNRKMIQRAE